MDRLLAVHCGSISLALAAAVLALPAAAQECTFTTQPLPRTFHQPDGRPVELRFRGDGANHWYEDGRGFPVVQTRSGYFYARRAADGGLEATGALVGEGDPARAGLERDVVPVPRRAGHARTALQHAPAAVHSGGPFLLGAGSVENLVLLVRFSDHGPAGQNRTLPSNANVGTIMNAVGGDPVLAPTGSVRDHYLENSYGQFSIDSTVVGWLDLPQSEAYYANGNSGLTDVTWELVNDALALADPLVDFADFDEDGDGWIDAITFLHSGYGAEWGGTDQYGTDYWDRMWSHKWTIPTWTSAEGVQVGDYNISPGLWDTFGSDPGRIGVVVHELGHFFGLPDLYDTDGGGYGTGAWCVMGYGSWGFDWSQLYPSHMCAWCKVKLGWVEPQRLLPGAHVAPQVETSPTIFLLDSGYPAGEYLLIENRQPVGFDAVVPQGGLAIWHIDENKGSFNWNDPNTDEGYPGLPGWPGNGSHYRVALLQPDGFYDLEQGGGTGDTGDVYRAGFATVLSTTTTPNSRTYQSGTIVTNGNRIEGVGASSASMAFTYVNTTAPKITSTYLPPSRPAVPYSAVLTRTGGTGPFTWTEFRDAPGYVLNDLGAQPFAAGGTAQSFHADDGRLAVTLPFVFPYYETGFTRVSVTPDGCVDLAPLENESFNTTPWMRLLPRIGGLWDDLRTDGLLGNDVYVDTSVFGAVRIRWQAETSDAGLPANFAITLNQDGRIRFDYGGGNTGLTPTVGISRGLGGDFVLADTHDGQPALTSASSLEFVLQGSQLPPGLSLSSAGVLSGTAPPAGTYQFRVRATDSIGRYDQRLVTLYVGFGKIRVQSF